MIKLPVVRYCNNLEESRPDANLYLRFLTEYLTEIRPGEIQTSMGVVNLPQPNLSERLHHKDKILFLGRQIEKGRFEGSIKKISNVAYYSFREYLHVLQVPHNSTSFPKPKEAVEPQEYL